VKPVVLVTARNLSMQLSQQQFNSHLSVHKLLITSLIRYTEHPC